MKKKVKTIQSVVLRIDSKMLSQVDQVVADRVGLSRHAWLLEAVAVHLKKAKRS